MTVSATAIAIPQVKTSRTLGGPVAFEPPNPVTVISLTEAAAMREI